MSEIDEILDIANAEVGYLEKSKQAYINDPTILYDKTAGVGNDNYTKYAKEMDELNVYNGIKQGYAWCNVFIDWIFMQSVGLQRASELLIGWSAGCTQDWIWLKNAGRVVDNAQRGDLIFFKNLCHIGIVEKVENNKIYTIEGNTSDKAELIINGGQVAKKVYDINSDVIYGFARPNYNASESKENTNNEIIYATIKKGSKGNLVRIAQEKLLAKGYILSKYGADGSFGQETENAVKQLQKDAFPNNPEEWDGIIGNKTWAILNSNFVKPTKPSYPGYYIVKGQHSEDVRKVQEQLIAKGYNLGKYGADSIFGNATLKAVKQFQKNNGLKDDGIVGEKTWNKLFLKRE